VEPAGRTRILSMRVDDQLRGSADATLTLDTTTLSDGQHRVEVVVHDTSRLQNVSSAVWTFVSDNTAPRLDLSLDPAEGPLEGHTAVLHLRADKPVHDVRATVNARAVRLQADPSGSWWLLYGVAPGPRESEMRVQLSATDMVGNATELERVWPVRRTTFPEDDFDLRPSDDELQAHADEDRRLAPYYRQVSGPRLWDGPFRVQHAPQLRVPPGHGLRGTDGRASLSTRRWRGRPCRPDARARQHRHPRPRGGRL
jgi:hypothetical protein